MDEFYGGDQQALTGAVGVERNGYTIIKFRKKLTSADTLADNTLTNSLTHVIWSFGQVYPDYSHSPPSGIEAGTAKNPMFYKPDEIKYHGSVNRGATTINFFERDILSNADCSGSSTLNCNASGCQYNATWAVKSNHVLFIVSAMVADNSWISIGFSDNRLMGDTDVVAAAVSTDGTSMIHDRWSTARGVQPRIDQQNDILYSTVSRANGITTMTFIRKLNTGDTTDDISLDTPRFFVFGYDGPADVSANTISYHRSTPVVSNDRISLERCTDNSVFAQLGGSVAHYVSFIVLALCLSLAYMLQ
jgi:hypothetical protein